MANKTQTAPDAGAMMVELADTVRRIENMRFLVGFKEKRRDELITALRPLIGRDEVRSRFIDFDARRDPKTAHYCPMCQKDIDPASDHVEVRLITLVKGSQPHAVHADDERMLDLGVLKLPPGGDDLGRMPMGRDCARRLGKEWTMARRVAVPLIPEFGLEKEKA